MTAGAAFEIGRTYSTRSVGDWDCILSLRVAARTAKTITTEDGKVFRISIINGVEGVMPHGRHSMAPRISADAKEIPQRPRRASTACVHGVHESELCERCDYLDGKVRNESVGSAGGGLYLPILGRHAAPR